MERGLSILWIDAICGSVQNSMTPPLKERGPPSARLTRSASLRSTNGAAIGRYSRIMAEAERLRQSLLADAGRGDLLKTIIDRVELPSERSADDPVARPAHAGRSVGDHQISLAGKGPPQAAARSSTGS